MSVVLEVVEDLFDECNEAISQCPQGSPVSRTCDGHDILDGVSVRKVGEWFCNSHTLFEMGYDTHLSKSTRLFMIRVRHQLELEREKLRS